MQKLLEKEQSSEYKEIMQYYYSTNLKNISNNYIVCYADYIKINRILNLKLSFKEVNFNYDFLTIYDRLKEKY